MVGSAATVSPDAARRDGYVLGVAPTWPLPAVAGAFAGPGLQGARALVPKRAEAGHSGAADKALTGG
ncbi:hypothetical protein GCM10010274_43610 [Streptomyces lavendofoliae]|uniref:Uncharacterized protein n=1 Tax=Streptomyces lavendofoliae TaxID=67314 RepID=A0A918I0G0_9ACTN|nr:hypothetical protein GCM10010274_43610 [Streptomyces lavendofoliae]